MTALVLSRAQFGFTIGYHILWPTYTIGISSYVACLSLLWWRTGNTVYRDLMRFWSKLFAMGFGMGVITGVVISYEIGANWSGYARAVGNVLSPLFMYEALSAFFLEAGFVGIVLFGEGRVSRGTHFFACCMVAFGSLLSATWILAANSWMQTPAGAVRDAAGIFHPVDWLAIIISPSFPFRFMHMVCASFLTGAFVVGAVSAFHLWQSRHLETAQVAFSMAMWTVLILAPTQLVLGDLQGRNTLQYQPTKLAAMEGLWNSGHGVAATLVAWPDQAREKNLYEIAIPHAASLYLTHSWNGYVQGLKAVPRSDRPIVPIVFFAFRVMVGIGIILLSVAITGAVLRWRGRLFTTRWFQLLAMAAAPLGFVAVLAGWTVTETGRQPYVVYGLLRTADAVSPITAGAVTSSLTIFFVIYNILLLAFLGYATLTVLRGPAPKEAVPRHSIRPGLDKSAPTIVGAPPSTHLPAAGA